ncbi:MAG TPA: CoA transferase, partial [Tepidisphaeraceae bacterium]|nr:CoA transferase [Tepidisphaeraceae bacterium]
NYLTGPFTAMLLADLGAEVIKVEPRDGGDPFRGWEEHGYSSNFRCVNRNKRSLTLDIQSDQGREILFRLAEKSDVLIENHRPGVMQRLGIDYASIAARNRRIIYCSISGFGEVGPAADLPGYDTIGQARSGLLSLLSDLSDPRPVGISLSDHITALYAVYGILAALHARDRSGMGQEVKTSLLQATVSFAQEAASRYFATGITPQRQTRVRAAQVFAFLAADGLPFVIHLSSPQKFWQQLIQAIDRAELQDARFIDRKSRIKNYDALREILAKIFSTAPRETWLKRLQQNDVPCSAIQSIADVFNDPQVQALGMRTTLKHPTMGNVDLSGSGVSLSDTPISYRSAPPLLGENAEAILAELGYYEPARQQLRRENVI